LQRRHIDLHTFYQWKKSIIQLKKILQSSNNHSPNISPSAQAQSQSQDFHKLRQYWSQEAVSRDRLDFWNSFDVHLEWDRKTKRSLKYDHEQSVGLSILLPTEALWTWWHGPAKQIEKYQFDDWKKKLQLDLVQEEMILQEQKELLLSMPAKLNLDAPNPFEEWKTQLQFMAKDREQFQLWFDITLLYCDYFLLKNQIDYMKGLIHE
jgi:hypothetical protein